MTILWNATDLEYALGVIVPSDVTATGVSINTRSLHPGDIFIALKGEQTDGHQWVDDALVKGAAAVVVSKPHPSPRSITVHDTTKALTDLGRYARHRLCGTVVGVTGSVGKTTTKEMLAGVLSMFGSTYATKGNLNNHFGVPLTLANMPADTQYAVIEMGMNHAHEIDALTRQALPNLAVITAIAPVHLENFENLAGIAAAKAEITNGLVKGGAFLYNVDHPEVATLQHAGKNTTATTFSVRGNHADLQAKDITFGPHQTTFRLEGNSVTVEGSDIALVSAATVALGVVRLLGLDSRRALASIAAYRPVQGRGLTQRLLWKKSSITIIDQSYNSSPIATIAALEAFGRLTVLGRRIAVLGDMKELGATAIELHLSLLPALKAAAVDKVLTVGPLMGHLFEALPSALRLAHADNVDAAATLLSEALEPADTILIKGSHSMNLEKILTQLKESVHAV